MIIVLPLDICIQIISSRMPFSKIHIASHFEKCIHKLVLLDCTGYCRDEYTTKIRTKIQIINNEMKEKAR